MKKKFEHEGSFRWTLGCVFILVAIFIMFNKEETLEIQKYLERFINHEN